MNTTRRGLLRMMASLPFVGHLVKKPFSSPMEPYRQAGLTALNAINRPAVVALLEKRIQDAWNQMHSMMIEQMYMNGQCLVPGVIERSRIEEMGGRIVGQFYQLPGEPWERLFPGIERKFDPNRLPA